MAGQEIGTEMIWVIKVTNPNGIRERARRSIEMSREQIAPGLYLYNNLEEAQHDADERAVQEPIYVAQVVGGWVPVNAAQNRDYLRASKEAIVYTAEPAK